MAREYQRWWPAGPFEDQNGTVVPVQDASVTMVAASANNLIVAGVSGKIIIVLEMSFYAAVGATGVIFKNGSGGSLIKSYPVQAVASVPPNEKFPPNQFGYLRTTVGTGLYADCNGAGGATVNISYIVATP